MTDTPAFWSLVVVAGVQAGGLLIWGATLTQRVQRLEQDAQHLRKVPERLAVLESEIKGMANTLANIDHSTRWMRDPAATGRAGHDPATG